MDQADNGVEVDLMVTGFAPLCTGMTLSLVQAAPELLCNTLIYGGPALMLASIGVVGTGMWRGRRHRLPTHGHPGHVLAHLEQAQRQLDGNPRHADLHRDLGALCTDVAALVARDAELADHLCRYANVGVQPTTPAARQLAVRYHDNRTQMVHMAATGLAAVASALESDAARDALVGAPSPALTPGVDLPELPTATPAWTAVTDEGRALRGDIDIYRAG